MRGFDKFPWEINGVPIPTPTKWSVSEEDVVTGYSNKQMSDGSIYKSVIRTRINAEMRFGLLSDSDLALLTELFRTTYLDITYPDVEPGISARPVTKTFVIKERPRELLVLRDNGAYWKGLTVKLTEV